MKKVFFLLVFAIGLQSQTMFSQEFKKPSDGKAMVYFIRATNLGSAINFKYFDTDKYLGKFSGKNYIAYEAEAGKHLFWAKSENVEFMEADLKANGVYLIQVKPKMGGLKAAVRLEVVDANDAKLMEKIKKLMSKKKPATLNMKKAEKETAKIKEYLEKYERRKSGETKGKIKVLQPDQDYKG